jgi:uncharacterized protein YutE (UPF0331/DUF86 family)
VSQVDPLRLRDLLGHINESLGRLRQLSQLDQASFLADFRHTDSAKYLLIVASEAAIDMCNHVAARQAGKAPASYADCFLILAELGVITEDLASRLQRMARFRNLVVHLYGKVDNAQVYAIIRHDLGDLDDFGRAILRWLDATAGAKSA